MATRQSREGLTAETAALTLTPQQRAAVELQALEPPEEQYEETPAERIAGMLEDHRDAARASVKLYRVVGPNQFNWCADYSPEEYETMGLPGVREQWGAGTYQIRVYAAGDDGRYCVRGKANITIEPQRNLPATIQPQQNNDLARVLETIAAGQQRLMEAIANKPAADPMVQMTAMFGLMKGMREAMGLDATPQKSSIGEIVDAVRELRGVAEEINPPATSEKADDPMSMLGTVLTLVKSGMGQQQAEVIPQVTYTPPSSEQVPTPAPTHPQMPQTEDEEMQLLLVLTLKKLLKQLVEKAAANADINETAEWIAEEMPDEIVDYFLGDEWWALLRGVAPAVEPHKEWLTKVRDATLPLFDDAEDETPPLKA